MFERLTERKEGALIAYVMGGDPTPGLSARVVDAVARGGADIIELGIPFSDPIADGSSIQAAGVRSLRSGTTPEKVLEIAKLARRRHDIPVALMTYYNILYARGVADFLDSAKASGVEGLVIPDLPLDEMGEYAAQGRRRGLDTVFLAAPTTTAQRMRLLVGATTGYLYLVSVLGVTGARDNVGQETIRLIRRAKRFTGRRVPLAVGFGISRPEHVSSVIAAGAEAVIVGSGIVNRVAGYERGETRMLREVEAYVRSMKDATRPHRS